MKNIILLALLSLSPILHAYETCTPENSYLESLLPPVDPTSVVRGDFPAVCVEAAHLSLPATGFYGFCPTPHGKPARSHRRACVSERYVRAVHSNLVDVSDCLGYDVRLAFATFNLESAVHLNAIGAAFDVGVGQLTKSAIDEVNLNAFDRALRAMRASGKASCRRLVPFMTKHASTLNERCGFMSLPQNPARNLLYSILLLQQNQRVITNLWNRLEIKLPPTVDAVRLRTLMMMLAYNSGPAGISSTVAAYAKQMGAALTDKHFDFEGVEPGSFTVYIAQNFPSADASARKRVSKYIGHVMVAARRADRLAGGTQACLHTDYFTPPVRIAHPELTHAPDTRVARNLIDTNMLKLAEETKTCHDFEFTFLGRTQTVNDLSPELKARHDELCK